MQFSPGQKGSSGFVNGLYFLFPLFSARVIPGIFPLPINSTQEMSFPPPKQDGTTRLVQILQSITSPLVIDSGGCSFPIFAELIRGARSDARGKKRLNCGKLRAGNVILEESGNSLGDFCLPMK